MKVIGNSATRRWPAVRGATPFSFHETQGWGDFAGGKGLAVLIGDDACGPHAFFTSMPPMEGELERGPSHGHASDNWRITVRGMTNVGKDAYAPGQFRFQDGGVPYAGDNVAWGPEGGFGLVFFGDRRGFPIRIVKRDHPQQAPLDAFAKAFSAEMAFEILEHCPGAPAIRTTIGESVKGHFDGGFEDARSWLEAAPGTRLAVALLGDPTAGPVLALMRCEAGATVFPTATLGSEVIHLVLDGSCTFGEVNKEVGDFWVSHPESHPGITAGPRGLSHMALIGDRRAVATLEAAGSAASRSLAAAIQRLTSELQSKLEPA